MRQPCLPRGGTRGADGLATDWLTLTADFLGFRDDDCHEFNDGVFRSAVGFEVNPFDRPVLAANF